MNLYDHIGNENFMRKTVIFAWGYMSEKMAFLGIFK